jgi:hypothetical protein
MMIEAKQLRGASKTCVANSLFIHKANIWVVQNGMYNAKKIIISSIKRKKTKMPVLKVDIIKRIDDRKYFYCSTQKWWQ